MMLPKIVSFGKLSNYFFKYFDSHLALITSSKSSLSLVPLPLSCKPVKTIWTTTSIISSNTRPVNLNRLILSSSTSLFLKQQRQITTKNKVENFEKLRSISLDIIEKNELKVTDQKLVVLAQQLVNTYYESNPLERFHFLNFLSDDLSSRLVVVNQAASAYFTTQSRNEPFDPALLVDRLQRQIRQPYNDLFRSISKLHIGVKFLVDLRSDLISVLSHQELAAELTPSNKVYLRLLSTQLSELLSLWFSAGFIRLERITWDSPTSILQKISEYEAVHPITSWLDLKHRLGLYRRCYTFSHTCLQGEPLVILHVALTSSISSSIQEIINFQRENLFKGAAVVPANTADPSKSTPVDGYCPPFFTTVINGKVIRLQAFSPPPKLHPPVEDPKQINAAVFYSISSTQKGLNGIDLGNKLIKQVASGLKSEFPMMSLFSSLSPIPNFTEYLITVLQTIQKKDDPKQIKKIWTRYCDMDMLYKALGTEDEYEFWNRMIQLIRSGNWITDLTLVESFKEPLMRICAHYLYNEKRRGYALNPVENFHLKNGAVLWRLNWLADISTRGLSNSCSMMVNYRYFLDQYEENSEIYLNQRRIITGEEFDKWLP